MQTTCTDGKCVELVATIIIIIIIIIIVVVIVINNISAIS